MSRSERMSYIESTQEAGRLFVQRGFAGPVVMLNLSVDLNAKLGQPWLEHAQGHRDIIRRFGRFPHRNLLLGRPTAEAEASFLITG